VIAGPIKYSLSFPVDSALIFNRRILLADIYSFQLIQIQANGYATNTGWLENNYKMVCQVLKKLTKVELLLGKSGMVRGRAVKVCI
jgi:hypothetical protein